ncbi:MAG: VWA domain-containing protein [Candidatus Helarchaeota archaeon]
MAQKDFETEDTVLCLDISRSMARKDFYPSRLAAAKEALITFVQLKHEIDKDDRFALVTFSTNAKIIQELTNDPEQIINAIKSVTPQGISSLGEGLAVALHVVSDQILKQGANINRVIVISDGKPWLGTIDPLEKARIMGEVGVIVDTIEISTSRATWGQNILEAATVLGEYHQATNANYLLLTMRSLSHKKDVFELKKSTPKLHLIAADLLNPKELTEEILDAIKQMKGLEEEKCIICRTTSCNICDTTNCGRLCPYCKNYIHLCCAKKWSEESKMAEANVFRCPHCLFLLRLPEKVMVRTPLKQERKSIAPESQEAQRAEGTKTSTEVKVGDFVVEHGQVKLIAKLADEEKEFYLSWDNWGSRDFTCNIISGMNEIICKDFTPKIDWIERFCSGFVLRDVLGWFSKPSIEQGIFLLDLVQFENWCKVVLADIQHIKKVISQRPEVTVESDKLIDFEFIVDVNYKEPIDTTDRMKLDQRLLEDAIRYLQFIRNRPYTKLAMNKILEIPKTPIETSMLLEAVTFKEPPLEMPVKESTIPPQDFAQPDEEPILSIENPYTGKKVELPRLVSKDADIGTARTLSISPQIKPQKTIQEHPRIETSTKQKLQEKMPAIAENKKVKLRCSTCQKWFEVKKFGQYSCPNCKDPLKLAIQCKNCQNWFSVSKPGRYKCPNCKTIIDATKI